MILRGPLVEDFQHNYLPSSSDNVARKCRLTYGCHSFSCYESDALTPPTPNLLRGWVTTDLGALSLASLVKTSTSRISIATGG